MEKGYHEKVKKILGMLYPTVPVTMVNAGIGGDSAPCGLKRMDRDVLSYQPDLVVCYGLNDAMGGEDGVQAYTEALQQIFQKIKAASLFGSDFLNPQCEIVQPKRII